jgi:CheY-like chemotaxis protein
MPLSRFSLVTATPTAPILLVEDDRLLRDAFRMLLEDAGYEVTEAGSAAEALAAVAARPPALILLDLGLPDRPGLDVVRELTQTPTTREIPVVALTGRVGPEEQRLCMEAGCTQYLAKPIEPRELLRRLPDWLNRG